jgi:hypothetical protein
LDIARDRWLSCPGESAKGILAPITGTFNFFGWMDWRVKPGNDAANH